MSELNVHDADVVGITIACAERLIVIHLQYAFNDSIEYSDVVFRDVAGHHLECVLEGNIIFDIQETPLPRFMDAEWTRFEACRAFGWPDVRAIWQSRDELVNLLESSEVHAYEILTSYGMMGFVLAKSVEQRFRDLPWRAPE